VALNAPKLADLMNSNPIVAMKSSGTNFSTVVTIWVIAMFRTPDRLITAGIHSPNNAITIDQIVACSGFQNTST
jgi:hypothetical protein